MDISSPGVKNKTSRSRLHPGRTRECEHREPLPSTKVETKEIENVMILVEFVSINIGDYIIRLTLILLH